MLTSGLCVLRRLRRLDSSCRGRIATTAPAYGKRRGCEQIPLFGGRFGRHLRIVTRPKAPADQSSNSVLRSLLESVRSGAIYNGWVEFPGAVEAR